jgi:hypothetical protein
MRATNFEFRYRFWFICLTYFVGFECYWFDHVNAAVALARWLFSASDPHLHSLAARHAIQGLFVLAGRAGHSRRLDSHLGRRLSAFGGGTRYDVAYGKTGC